MKKLKVLIRPAIFLAITMLCAVFSAQAQSLSLKDFEGKPSIYNSNRGLSVFTHKPIDTVQCLFLEITDSVVITTKWTKGFVVRKGGYISFGKNTSVTEPYLPITTGIVSSELMYYDKSKVLNKALQVVML